MSPPRVLVEAVPAGSGVGWTGAVRALSTGRRAGAERLRAATLAWAPLLGELHAVGLRPYLELEHGNHDDVLRLYCELDDELLLDASICDEGLPVIPPPAFEDDWTAFVQGHDSPERYLADVIIEPPLTFRLLAAKLRDLVDAVAVGDRPVATTW